MASTLGVEDAHPHPDELGEDEDAEPLHPWALEMYRGGLSFNGNERSKLFLGDGRGGFVDHSDLCGADSPLDGRGLVAADFDDDGDVDLFVHNLQRERHNLFRNELSSGAASGFVKVRLTGTRANRDAVGAMVTLEGPKGPVTQVVSRGSGFASCQPPELVFGLGPQADATLSVRWPGPEGRVESFGRVAAGSRVLLEEDAGEARPWVGAPFSLADPLPPGLDRAPGEPVPVLTLLEASGEPVQVVAREVADGGLLYLNFWASYCAPCVEELPALQALDDRPGSTVLAVSVDVPRDRDRARAVLERAGVRFRTLYLSLDEDLNEGGIDDLIDLLRLPIPTTLVVDAEGRISRVLRGPVEAGD